MSRASRGAEPSRGAERRRREYKAPQARSFRARRRACENTFEQSENTFSVERSENILLVERSEDPSLVERSENSSLVEQSEITSVAGKNLRGHRRTAEDTFEQSENTSFVERSENPSRRASGRMPWATPRANARSCTRGQRSLSLECQRVLERRSPEDMLERPRAQSAIFRSDST